MPTIATGRSSLFFLIATLFLLIFSRLPAVWAAADQEPVGLTIAIAADPANGTNFAFTATGPGINGDNTDYGFLDQIVNPSILDSPAAIEIDEAGNLYVASTTNGPVQKYSLDGNFLGQIGSVGTGPGELENAVALAVDSVGNLFVGGANRVLKFDPDGSLLNQFDNLVQESLLSVDAAAIDSIAVDSEDNLYVTGTFDNHVYKYDATGAFITRWQTVGEGDMRFYASMGLVVDVDDNLYVANSDNSRIEIFEPDGTKVDEWIRTGQTGFGFMTDLAFDSEENLLIVNHLSDVVRKYDDAGDFLNQIGSGGSGAGELSGPLGVVVDPEGNVYVANALNHRIEIFRELGVADFVLDDAEVDDGDGIQNSISFNDATAGQFTISGSIAPGWRINGVECTGGEHSATIDAGDVMITIEGDAAVTCTLSIARGDLYLPLIMGK